MNDNKTVKTSPPRWRESLLIYLSPASLRMLTLGFAAGLPLLLVLGTSSSESALAPLMHYCIEKFGPNRCMFESNFPVDKISYSYNVFWNACKLMAKGASTAEKADLFAGAAAKCYKLEGIL